MKGIQSFKILNISENASFEEAKKAYKQLVKIWHPDQFAEQPEKQSVAQEKLKEINVAYREFIQLLNTRGRADTEERPMVHENVQPRKRMAPKESNSLWYTFITNLKDNLGDAKQFILGKKATAGRRFAKINESKSAGLNIRADGKGVPLKFEEVLQKSLRKGSRVSKSAKEKKKPGARKQNSKVRIKAHSTGAYRIRSRSKRLNKGRIEAIRPIEKIKGIGKVR